MNLIKTSKPIKPPKFQVILEAENLDEVIKLIPKDIKPSNIKKEKNSLSFETEASIESLHKFESALSGKKVKVDIKEVSTPSDTPEDEKLQTTQRASKVIDTIKKIIDIIDSEKLSPSDIDDVLNQSKALLGTSKNFSDEEIKSTSRKILGVLVDFSDADAKVFIDGVQDTFRVDTDDDLWMKIQSWAKDHKGISLAKSEVPEFISDSLSDEEQSLLKSYVMEDKGLSSVYGENNQAIIKIFTNKGKAYIDKLLKEKRISGYWASNTCFIIHNFNVSKALEELKEFPYEYSVTNMWGKKLSSNLNIALQGKGRGRISA